MLKKNVNMNGKTLLLLTEHLDSKAELSFLEVNVHI